MRNVLIIDDEFVICEVLSRIFVSENYSVRTRHTIEEGLQLCLQERPDILLLDVNLPDGSGLDLCSRLKADPRLKRIPVIILTGSTTEEEGRAAGLESGADNYAAKPFVVEDIVEMVKDLVGRSFEFRGPQPV